MGSLEKVTTDEGLEKWAVDVRKRLDTDESVDYVVEPKIDGSRSSSSTRTASSCAARRAATANAARTSLPT